MTETRLQKEERDFDKMLPLIIHIAHEHWKREGKRNRFGFSRDEAQTIAEHLLMPPSEKSAYQLPDGAQGPEQIRRGQVLFRSIGCLAIVHWAAGLVGYFPTYTLGNVISGQLWHQVRRDIPDVDERLERDGLAVRRWVRALRGGPAFDMDYVIDRVWMHDRPLRFETIRSSRIPGDIQNDVRCSIRSAR